MSGTRGLGHAIDFGTSTSAIVVCQPDGATTPVPVPSGRFGVWSMPTSIFVQSDGSVLVGNAADNARHQRPDAYRREFKREFGSPKLSMVGSTEMTADEMTVHVLRFLRELAQARVPGGPERVVITVPASWEGSRHDLMRDVAAKAGYHDAAVSLVPEPVAALADVFGKQGGDDVTALVYDLGGGTFDCAIARGAGSGFEVLGVPGGIGDIGGADFDRLLLRLLGDRLGPEVSDLLEGPATDTGVLTQRLSLRDECERIKWELSRERRYEDTVTALGRWLTVERSEFEALIRPLLAETLEECGRLLRQHDMTWRDVDRVVPTGGSSNIPLVMEMLGQSTGLVVLRPASPEKSVVSGAAALCHAALGGASLEEYAKSAPMPEVSGRDSWLFDDRPGTVTDPAREAGAAELVALFGKHKDKLPTQRKPNIIVCGETGTGKTTTINTLFGEEVGEVGYFSRGTSQDELYEWESEGHTIDVVDLPGLGDTKQRDKEYREMYRRRVAKADGFIVVIAPPRPANDATIKTVNLLLSCGVNPERIVFAFNRMGDINARIGGRMRRLTLDGLAGPSTPDDARLVDMAREAFNKDLSAMVRNGQLEGKFPLEQVVAYDALSGWNLFEVLDAVLRSLPGDTLMRWRDTVNRAAKDHQRRSEERIALEAFHHSRKMAELEEQMKRLGGRQAGGQPGRGGDGKKAPSGTADPAADGDSGKRGRAAAVKGKADQEHQRAETERQQAEAERKRRLEEAESKRRQQEADKRRLEEGARQRQQEEAARQRRKKEAEDERKRLEAERERLEAQRRELLAEQERLERQREAARQIATRRDAHLDTVAEKFAYWAAEKVDIAVAKVKNVASAVKRWWRGG